MRHLYLFRHAEAVHSDKYRDRERPLTAAGRNVATRLGAFLRESRREVDLAVVSDAVRAQETWELAAAAWGAAPEARILPKLFQAERRDLMDMARELPDSIEAAMFVGHNPAMSEFSANFAGAGDREALTRLARGFPPGGLAVFDVDVDEWRKLRWGGGALALFMT
jgi:phosphohistidine phosphatase